MSEWFIGAALLLAVGALVGLLVLSERGRS